MNAWAFFFGFLVAVLANIVGGYVYDHLRGEA